MDKLAQCREIELTKHKNRDTISLSNNFFTPISPPDLEPSSPEFFSPVASTDRPKQMQQETLGKKGCSVSLPNSSSFSYQKNLAIEFDPTNWGRGSS